MLHFLDIILDNLFSIFQHLPFFSIETANWFKSYDLRGKRFLVPLNFYFYLSCVKCRDNSSYNVNHLIFPLLLLYSKCKEKMQQKGQIRTDQHCRGVIAVRVRPPPQGALGSAGDACAGCQWLMHRRAGGVKAKQGNWEPAGLIDKAMTILVYWLL